jgi:hypothetical protein
MISFNALIKRFDEKGEKTGWTYIEVPAKLAQVLKPGNKKGFRTKGKLDAFVFEGFSLLPIGDGNFILPLNSATRKAIGKQKGAIVAVEMEEDVVPYQLNTEMMECMEDEPMAIAAFNKLPNSHKNYYSKWVDSAKTDSTKARRIAIVISGLAQGLEFGEMLRKAREDRKMLGW